MTTIMVSHNMDDIATLATRLIVMSKGTLDDDGHAAGDFQARRTS